LKVRLKIIKNSADKSCDQLIGWFEMQFLPHIGEFININGDGYYVHERSWAIKDGITYCYIRVSVRKN